MRTHELIIGGAATRGQAREIRSPYNGDVVSVAHFADERALADAVAAADAAAPILRGLPLFRRAEILAGMVERLRGRAEDLAAAISDEAAKPYKLAWAETLRCVATFENAAEECKRAGEGYGVALDSVAAGAGRHGIVRRFPVGPVLAIAPFNFPLNLVAHKMAPAIAAGCPIVVKPAEQTPTAALMLGRIAIEAGLPPEAMSVVPADRAVADALIEDDRFKLVTFTGSPAVGWMLKARSGKKKVVLELGGNAAAVLGADADLDWAVPRLAAGGFAHAGQVCIKVQRVFVHERIYATVLARLVEHTRTHMQPQPPADRTAWVSAMIDAQQADRIGAWVEEARQAGATLHCGGGRRGNEVEPMVLSEVDPRAKVSALEAFGPVVTVAPFSTWDEAIARVNDSVYGLQCAVFTNDTRALWQCFNDLEVGAVIHNDAPTFRVDLMPYGGIKGSGSGREGLRWAIASMSEERLLAFYPR